MANYNLKIIYLGNFKNLPSTVARRYQQKQFADLSSSNEPERQIIKQGEGVILNGTKYLVGDFLVVDICAAYCQPVFGKIVNINNETQSTNFKCQKFQTHFDSKYHAHVIDHIMPDFVNIEHRALKYVHPVTLVETKYTRGMLHTRYCVM